MLNTGDLWHVIYKHLPVLKTLKCAFAFCNIIIQNQAEKLAATESEICFLRGQIKSMGIELEVR